MSENIVSKVRCNIFSNCMSLAPLSGLGDIDKKKDKSVLSCPVLSCPVPKFFFFLADTAQCPNDTTPPSNESAPMSGSRS